MVKQADSLEGVVSRQYADENYNVFYSDSVLKGYNKPVEKLIFLYSEKYIVPVTISRRFFFKYAHICIEPAVIKDGNETLKSFLDDVCYSLRKVVKVHWISETPAAALFEEAPSVSKAIPFGSHIINLENDVETLWSNVHSKHRNVIKKAEKEGVQIVKGVSDKILNDYHSIDIETWERSNVRIGGVDYLKKQVDTLGKNIIFYMAYKDEEPQAGAIFYYNKAMCYYMHGASRNHSFTGSSNLLHWQAIQDMKTAGVKKYSFVGCRINEDENSKYHGIQRFKERFGGELFEGKRFKTVFKPFYYQLYRLLVDIKMSIGQGRLVHQKDTIDQEWHKWH